VLGPLFHRKAERQERAARAFLTAYHPELVAVFAALAQMSGTERPTYHWKAADLLRLLEAERPRSIVELGSGRTTAAFAAYADRYGAELVAFEQDPVWSEWVHRALAPITSRRPVRLVDVQVLPVGAAFAEPIPPGADFVYVDAPHVPRAVPFPTFTGKPAYLDVPRFLAAGGRPQLIVVDGRTDTVDAIREVASGYDFEGDYGWAAERGNVRHALRLARHSTFRRRRPM
jgi:hypothetical protein